MTTDEATTLRIASLKRYAVRELEQAKADAENAREHTLDALSAIRAAIELEDASQPIPYEISEPSGYALREGDPEKILAVEADLRRSEEVA